MQLELPWVGLIWLVPGGGLEPDELPVDGARREVLEETGLRLPEAELTGPVWARSIEVERSSGWVDTREFYFLSRVRAFTPRPVGLTAEERVWLRGWRWWSADALQSTDERVAPPSLGERLPALLEVAEWRGPTLELPARVYGFQPPRLDAAGDSQR